MDRERRYEEPGGLPALAIDIADIGPLDPDFIDRQRGQRLGIGGRGGRLSGRFRLHPQQPVAAPVLVGLKLNPGFHEQQALDLDIFFQQWQQCDLGLKPANAQHRRRAGPGRVAEGHALNGHGGHERGREPEFAVYLKIPPGVRPHGLDDLVFVLIDVGGEDQRRQDRDHDQYQHHQSLYDLAHQPRPLPFNSQRPHPRPAPRHRRAAAGCIIFS